VRPAPDLEPRTDIWTPGRALIIRGLKDHAHEFSEPRWGFRPGRPKGVPAINFRSKDVGFSGRPMLGAGIAFRAMLAPNHPTGCGAITSRVGWFPAAAFFHHVRCGEDRVKCGSQFRPIPGLPPVSVDCRRSGRTCRIGPAHDSWNGCQTPVGAGLLPAACCDPGYPYDHYRAPFSNGIRSAGPVSFSKGNSGCAGDKIVGSQTVGSLKVRLASA
jgi:hypothetical protein